MQHGRSAKFDYCICRSRAMQFGKIACNRERGRKMTRLSCKPGECVLTCSRMLYYNWC